MAGMKGTGGQVGQSRLPRGPLVVGTAVLAVLTLIAGVVLAARGPDISRAATILSDPRAVTLTLADGSTSRPTQRTEVPPGATVRTAPGGSATLASAQRLVLLGADSAVTVLDGSRQRLLRGLVMVDARRTGELALDAGAATVSTPRGSLVRVERSVLLRVASFRGAPSVRAAGRKATAEVTALHQVQVPFGGLPGRVTALALTRDSWERRFAQSLVTSDVDLSRLADALATDATVRAAVAVPASFTAAAPAEDDRPGETALSAVLARSADRPGPQTYAEVRELRREGGSWGVVAALVGADVATVSAALDGDVEPGGPVLAAPLPDPDATQPVVAAPAPTTQPDQTPSRAPGRGANPTPVPTSPPPSTPPPADPVGQVVEAVVSALPAPVRTLLPSSPLPKAEPLAPVVGTVTGLLAP